MATDKFKVSKSVSFTCNGVEHNLRPLDAIALGKALIAKAEEMTNLKDNPEPPEPQYVWVCTGLDNKFVKASVGEVCSMKHDASSQIKLCYGHPIFKHECNMRKYIDSLDLVGKLYIEIKELESCITPRASIAGFRYGMSVETKLAECKKKYQEAIEASKQLCTVHGVTIDLIKGVIV